MTDIVQHYMEVTISVEDLVTGETRTLRAPKCRDVNVDVAYPLPPPLDVWGHQPSADDDPPILTVTFVAEHDEDGYTHYVSGPEQEEA